MRSKNRDIPNNSNHTNGHDHGGNDSSSDEDDECDSGAQVTFPCFWLQLH